MSGNKRKVITTTTVTEVIEGNTKESSGQKKAKKPKTKNLVSVWKLKVSEAEITSNRTKVPARKVGGLKKDDSIFKDVKFALRWVDGRPKLIPSNAQVQENDVIVLP